MRNLAIWMQMSLDGYGSAPGGGPLDWPVVTDELTGYWQQIGEDIDAFIYGARTWGFMSQFWPRADTLPGASDFQARPFSHAVIATHYRTVP
jgi:dihydrofolate reductase